MKKQYLHSLFSLLAIVFFISLVGCNREPDIPLQGTIPVKMHCDVNGSYWKATDYYGASYINNILTVAGRANDGSVIKFKVRMPLASGLAVGTYPIDSTFKLTSGEGIYMPKNTSIYYTTHNVWGGFLKITYHSTATIEVSGQFGFTVKDSLTGDSLRITSGLFTLPYVTQIPVLTNTFNTTIISNGNSVPWTNTQNGANLVLIPPAPANANQLQFTAFNANDNRQFIFRTPVNLVPGTYSLGNSLTNFQAQYNDGAGNILYPTASDIITITSHDLINKHIIGVFQMNAKDTTGTVQNVNIVNGNFDMQYQ